MAINLNLIYTQSCQVRPETFGTPLVVRKKPDVVTPNRLDGNTDLEWQPGDSERRSNGHARHGDFTGSLLVGSRT